MIEIRGKALRRDTFHADKGYMAIFEDDVETPSFVG
jgi:hypothetical protein